MIYNGLVSVGILAILIFVHELGHFLVAKLCRVGVLEFAIGFGPKIFSFKWGTTRYSLRAIPLGGYVRMVGDDPRMSSPSSVPEDLSIEPVRELDEDEKKLLEDKSKWFLNKGYFSKVAIVFAGPLFNIIFAIMCSVSVVYFYGISIPQDKSIVGGVIPGSPADKSGIKEGDNVYEINGSKIEKWEELFDQVSKSNGTPLNIRVKRGDSEDLSLIVTPEPINPEIAVMEGMNSEIAAKTFRVGIAASATQEMVSFKEALVAGTLGTWYWTKMTIKGIVALIKRQISHKNIGGPIAIFQTAADTASKGADRVLSFMMMLSISLAVLNLLPIPILDGGHILFFTIEAIKGSKLPIAFYEKAQQLGMFVLLLLMILAFSNDITRLFGG